jgi:hypothetical protein
MADPIFPGDTPARNSTSSPKIGGTISHRSSFAENLRHSPRSQRHPSFTQAAVQELLNHPPAKTADPRFVGKDWRTIHVGELVDSRDVRWAELDTSIQDATTVCRYPPGIVYIVPHTDFRSC